MEYGNVTIETEDGSKLEYSVLAIFDVGGGSYVALLPTEDGNDEIVFYGCKEDAANQELELLVIEEEEEFAVVSEAFVNLMREYADEKGRENE